jgi:hypothetical protein
MLQNILASVVAGIILIEAAEPGVEMKWQQ